MRLEHGDIKRVNLPDDTCEFPKCDAKVKYLVCAEDGDVFSCREHVLKISDSAIWLTKAGITKTLKWQELGG